MGCLLDTEHPADPFFICCDAVFSSGGGGAGDGVGGGGR